MTDYVPYTPDEYIADAPATALHFQRWFENWIAGFEGAIGAARLRIGALQRLEPGTEIRSRKDAEQAGTDTPNASFAFMQAGTIRVTFDHRSTGSTTCTSTVKRTRNGTVVTLATFSTTAPASREVDCPVLPGDLLEVIGGASTGARISNIRFKTNGQDLWPGPPGGAILEGNTYNA